MNNNNTVRWIAIIVQILVIFFSVAFGAINSKVNRHDELIMEIKESQAEIRGELKYIINLLEKDK